MKTTETDESQNSDVRNQRSNNCGALFQIYV